MPVYDDRCDFEPQLLCFLLVALAEGGSLLEHRQPVTPTKVPITKITIAIIAGCPQCTIGSGTPKELNQLAIGSSILVRLVIF